MKDGYDYLDSNFPDVPWPPAALDAIAHAFDCGVEQEAAISLVKQTEDYAPTQNEIMTRWWKVEYGDGFRWAQVVIWRDGEDCPDQFLINEDWEPRSWFTNRQFATIPTQSP